MRRWWTTLATARRWSRRRAGPCGSWGSTEEASTTCSLPPRPLPVPAALQRGSLRTTGRRCDMPGLETCPVCDKELDTEDVDSCSLICWRAHDGGNVLLQMFCTLEHLWVWLNEDEENRKEPETLA